MLSDLVRYDGRVMEELDISKKLSQILSDPVYLCKTFEHDKWVQYQKAEKFISILSKVFILIILLSCTISILSSIPFEIANRISSLEDSYEIIRQSCVNEYMENHCNTTTIPDMMAFCQEKWACIHEPFKPPVHAGVFQYVADLRDVFFRELTLRSSALLGMTSAFILFFALKRARLF